ncbi:cytochrome c oxidase subunit vib [Lichtheimia corymbifera JMRC:FSU:9682]|uniref:Cytochrome c oxidase subunit n=1 Tax=Lichtheimia corymbifera JMRC:FSU:9682 TaxID=1263082 RepID=A0A068S918_9FUNG|nr:cytochrome c oxidase subunit vib [Lichtheimia corymbifera JMRC:FSU:9682]
MSEADQKLKLRTAAFDARFPNTNQTKHCWQNYVDYYKCVNARGEDFEPCKQFYRAFHSLCPNEWIEKWDTEREEGTNPSNFAI